MDDNHRNSARGEGVNGSICDAFDINKGNWLKYSALEWRIVKLKTPQQKVKNVFKEMQESSSEGGHPKCMKSSFHPHSLILAYTLLTI